MNMHRRFTLSPLSLSPLSRAQRSRWITVALVCAAALLALPEARAQVQGAGAMFEGRPAMAGAQGGQGAQAGMPQGGLGVQGSEGQKGLVLRKPTGLDSMPALPGKDPGMNTLGAPAAPIPAVAEKGLASEQRSSLSKARRAAKKTARRTRTGVGEVDSRTGAVPSGTPK